MSPPGIKDVATRAGVSVGTVRSFEAEEKTPMPNNLAALQNAVAAAGLRLLFD